METSEVLNKAADLIEERGWVQGSTGWGGEVGGLCLEGGIMAAAGIDASGQSSRVVHLWSCPAYVAVANYLDRDPDMGLGRRLWLWNDTRSDAAEVIEVLRAAAVIEAAKERADVHVVEAVSS